MIQDTAELSAQWRELTTNTTGLQSNEEENKKMVTYQLQRIYFESLYTQTVRGCELVLLL